MSKRTMLNWKAGKSSPNDETAVSVVNTLPIPPSEAARILAELRGESPPVDPFDALLSALDSTLNQILADVFGPKRDMDLEAATAYTAISTALETALGDMRALIADPAPHFKDVSPEDALSDLCSPIMAAVHEHVRSQSQREALLEALADNWLSTSKRISPMLIERVALATLADYSPLPYYPEIRFAAGPGAWEDAKTESIPLLFRSEWLHSKSNGAVNQLVLVRVSGDSMDPLFLDGDVILIDRSSTEIKKAKTKGSYDPVFALIWEQDQTLSIKRLGRLPNGMIRVWSDNPDGPRMEVRPESIIVHGRVIWVARELL